MLYSIVVSRYRKLFITYIRFRATLISYSLFYKFKVPSMFNSYKVRAFISFPKRKGHLGPLPLSWEPLLKAQSGLPGMGIELPLPTCRNKRMAVSPLVLLYISCRCFPPVVLLDLPHQARESHRHPNSLNVRVAHTRPNCPSKLETSEDERQETKRMCGIPLLAGAL